MKLIQTQYPLADLSFNNSNKKFMILVVILLTGAAIAIYVSDKANRKRQE